VPAGCIPLPKRKTEKSPPLTILNEFRLLAADSILLFDAATSKTIKSDACTTDTADKFLEFVYTFVVLNYGIRRVNNWLKINPDKTVLQLITPQDLAYAILVYENNYAQFHHDYLSANGSLGPEDQRPAQDLTSSRKTKLNAYECNWDAKAIQYYMDLSTFFFKLMRPTNGLWVQLLDQWDEFHAGVDGSKMHRYKQNKRDDERAANHGQSTGNTTLYIPFQPTPSGDGQFCDPTPATAMPEHTKKRGAAYSKYTSEESEDEFKEEDVEESDEDVVPPKRQSTATRSSRRRK
jgi:hypothetical protein